MTSVRSMHSKPHKYSGVARIYCEDREAKLHDFRAGCSSDLMTTGNSFVTNKVLIKKAVSC